MNMPNFMRFTAIVFSLLVVYLPVHAQIDWRLLQPNTGYSGFYDGFVQGQKERQETERRNLEIENIR